MGCESWPDEALYTRCPRCGEPTTRHTNLYPLDSEEAASILSHIEFEKYYERRETAKLAHG